MRRRPVKRWLAPVEPHPQLNLSAADRLAYDKYCAWCRSLGVEPAEAKLYLKINRTSANVNVLLA